MHGFIEGTRLLRQLLAILMVASPFSSMHRSVYAPRRTVKTVYNSRVRFLAFVGVEGAGHDSWRLLLARCPQFYCRSSPELHNAILPDVQSALSGQGLFAVNRTSVRHRRKLVMREFGRAQRDASALNSSVAVLLNLADATTDSWSFVHGPEPSLHLDIPELVSLAERARVDLRFGVLLKDPAEVYASTALQRSLGVTLEAQAASLVDSTFILDGQLDAIDPEFFQCVDTSEDGHAALPFLRFAFGHLPPHVLQPLMEAAVALRRTTTENAVLPREHQRSRTADSASHVYALSRASALLKLSRCAEQSHMRNKKSEKLQGSANTSLSTFLRQRSE
mmetsp:Transcript_4267/g.12462  ORF Transcript_4267/g.12462 Transcript_4267/m.12462 type:complete len:335 (+) Transcript_4267:51-1055(+)